MDKLTNGVRAAATAVIAVLLCGILLWLLPMSIFTTCYMDLGEHVYYAHGNAAAAIAGILAAVALFVLAKRLRPRMRPLRENTVRRIVWVCGLCAALYALALQVCPIADQVAILNTAAEMHEGDFTEFLPGGYMDAWPHQRGLVLLLYVLQFFFGGNNYLLPQMLNAVCLVVVWRCLYALGKAWLGEGLRARLVLICSVAFLPLSFYVTFVYGNLYGLAAALAGFVMLERWFARRVWRYAAAGGALMALSVVIKPNYAIFLVAYVLFLLLDAIVRRKAASVASAVLAVALYAAMSFGTGAAISAITGIPQSKGVPATGHITMGLQEGSRAPGWFNGYNYTIYSALDYDTNAADALARTHLKERVAELAGAPKQAVNFFTRKTASQWAEPTFQSVNIQETRKTNVEPPTWYLALCTPSSALSHGLLAVLDALQSVVYFGALAYFITRIRRGEVFHWTLAVVFLGGFLFHLVWEAKGQYTISFFVLLFPYAVQGLADCAQGLLYLWDARREKNMGVQHPKRALALLCCAAVLTVLVVATPLRRVAALGQTADEQAFAQYAAERGAPLTSGDYLLTDGQGQEILLRFQTGRGWPYERPHYTISHGGVPIVPDALGQAPEQLKDAAVTMATLEQLAAKYWTLIPCEDGFYICIKDTEDIFWAATRRDGAVRLENLLDLPEQVWHLTPV